MGKEEREEEDKDLKDFLKVDHSSDHAVIKLKIYHQKLAEEWKQKIQAEWKKEEDQRRSIERKEDKQGNKLFRKLRGQAAEPLT